MLQELLVLVEDEAVLVVVELSEVVSFSSCRENGLV